MFDTRYGMDKFIAAMKRAYGQEGEIGEFSKWKAFDELNDAQYFVIKKGKQDLFKYIDNEDCGEQFGDIKDLEDAQCMEDIQNLRKNKWIDATGSKLKLVRSVEKRMISRFST